MCSQENVMKNPFALIRLAVVAVLLGSAGAIAQTVDAQDATSPVTVEARAPLSATLLPTVSVDATPSTSESNPATMRIAATEPLRVTLLPTVYVNARAEREETATLLPTVRVTARYDAAEVADASDAAPEMPAIDGASPTSAAHSLVSRARTMPR
jgi:hypothetical protein